jgi:hypothetical protein
MKHFLITLIALFPAAFTTWAAEPITNSIGTRFG